MDMGGLGPSVPKPPGGGVAGVEPPLRGAPEARRAVGRGSDCKSATSPPLNVALAHVFYIDCLIDCGEFSFRYSEFHDERGSLKNLWVLANLWRKVSFGKASILTILKL
jgi:hypothetical protein